MNPKLPLERYPGHSAEQAMGCVYLTDHVGQFIRLHVETKN